MLTLLVLLPLIGALVAAFLPDKTAKLASLVFGVATLAFAAVTVLLPILNGTSYHFAHREAFDLIPSLGVKWSLGTDGIAAWLCVSTALMTLVALAMGQRVTSRASTFLALILALESFILGAFLSLDLVLFFTFFELTLFPIFFLIAGWGGERRRFAATKFFAYTFLGSILMLVGMIVLGFRVTGQPTFDIVELQRLASTGALWQDAHDLEAWVFWGFAAALLVKTPSFPFHTWMPDAYAESPTAVPVLSGIMVKLGTFGILRFLIPLFPDAMAANTWILMLLGVIGILYAGILAVVQRDALRLLAYSSISHMGFILVGLASLTHTGLMGAGFQMVVHTIIAGGMICLVSYLIQRRGTSDLAVFGGLKARMPMFATIFLILLLGSVGLPGLAGFVGEFLALMGAFEAGHAGLYGMNVGYAAAAGLGVVLSAAYLLYLFQQIFYGHLKDEANAATPDLTRRESALGWALATIVILLGLQPSLITKPIESSIQATRLMATAPAGSRPAWGDADVEVAANGDLQRSGTTIAPADLHPTQVASRP
jgi:NADH-quinone oxidoreductase subunit M